MLVCFHCQFENPNNHKYCQRCGKSLTHKTCSACSTNVLFSAQTCPNCGAFTGTVWLAIVAKEKSQQEGEESSLSSREYLDLGRRYRLLEGDRATFKQVTESTAPHQLFQGKVIDCQPLQKSVLGILLEQQAELLEDLDDMEDEQEREISLWQRIGIPELAKLYLTVKDYYPIIPPIHDAWEEEKQEIILLNDRSEWQLLGNWWQSDRVSVAEIVSTLAKIAEVWEPLTQANCHQSLLVENNLRIDRENVFGLEQLYPNFADTQPTLQDLAKLWQKILPSSQLEKFVSLKLLLEKLEGGAIATASDLFLKLDELAQSSASESSDSLPDEQAQNPESETEPQILESSIEMMSSSELPTDKLAFVPEIDEDTLDSDSIGSMAQLNEGADLSTAFLPMELLSLTDIGYTDRGRQRHHNEDFFGMRSQIKKQQSTRGRKFHARGLYIVCDGMGGHAAGEVASAMAVDTLQRYFVSNWQDELPARETIEKGILQANQAIFNINQKNARSGNGRMGTTLVMALLQDNRLAIAHVGDSRIYRVGRKGGLEQLTVDHEVGQKAIQSGVDPKVAYARPDAYQLTQALGPHGSKFLQPDIQFFDLQEDTLLLLCSDGLSDNNLIETHWQTYLTPLISSSNHLEKGLRKLVDFANQHNGHDNLTAIAIRVKVRPYLGGSNW